MKKNGGNPRRTAEQNKNCAYEVANSWGIWLFSVRSHLERYFKQMQRPKGLLTVVRDYKLYCPIIYITAMCTYKDEIRFLFFCFIGVCGLYEELLFQVNEISFFDRNLLNSVKKKNRNIVTSNHYVLSDHSFNCCSITKRFSTWIIVFNRLPSSMQWPYSDDSRDENKHHWHFWTDVVY